MRYFLILTAVGAMGTTAPHKDGACNQAIYDHLYKEIILETMKTKMTKKDFDARNNSIETLRALCYNQKSSWEKP